MPITKRVIVPPPPAPVGSEAAINAFIQGAPDAGAQKPSATPQASEVSEQITIRMPKLLLERATAMAERQGISRASYMKRALSLQLDQDEK